MVSRMVFNAQFELAEPDTSTLKRKRSFFRRKLDPRTLKPVSKQKEVVGVPSLNASTDSYIQGKPIQKSIQTNVKLMRIGKASSMGFYGDKDPSGLDNLRSRCVSSLFSPENFSFTSSLYIHSAMQKQSLETSESLQKSTQDEGVPTSKPRWKWTERVRWARRPLFSEAPLLILNFEGVLGDYFNDNFWDKQPSRLYLRAGWLRGLRQLSRSMQLVLMASTSRDKLEMLLEVMDDRKVKFDAVYRRHCRNERHLLDYSQVLKEMDPKGSVADSVLVISSLMLDDAEIAQRTGQELVYDASASLDKRWVGLNVPANRGSVEGPQVCLVPNPRMQRGYLSMPLDSISQAVVSLHQLSSRHSPFSFKAALAEADSESFYGAKTLKLPQFTYTKSKEPPVLVPKGCLEGAVDCVVLPASSFNKKPYVKIDLELLNDSRKL